MNSQQPSLEAQIYQTINDAIAKAVAERVSSYNSPLHSLIDKVVERHSQEIQGVLDRCVSTALRGDFEAALQDACAHKLARVLTSKMEGEIEKRANDLRANPAFRAKLTLAIEEVVQSFKIKQ